jgi:hypothetical protein
MIDIKAGDYVDVRMIALAIEGNCIVARLPSESAVHQVTIGAHQVQNTAPRSPDAIAADVVCSSYGGVSPLAARRIKRAKKAAN